MADGRPGPDERAGDQRDLQAVLAALAGAAILIRILKEVGIFK